jgi:hypothetical protein
MIPQMHDEEPILLISSDGVQFSVPELHLRQSSVLDKFLSLGLDNKPSCISVPITDSPPECFFEESESRRFKFNSISSELLSKIVDYLKYKYEAGQWYHKNATGTGLSSTTIEVPDFDIEPGTSMDLLLAAEFLNI